MVALSLAVARPALAAETLPAAAHRAHLTLSYDHITMVMHCASRGCLRFKSRCRLSPGSNVVVRSQAILVPELDMALALTGSTTCSPVVNNNKNSDPGTPSGILGYGGQMLSAFTPEW